MSNRKFSFYTITGKTFGFTLSEVLITLVVLGIISAITIPQLIVSYQKNITLEKFKKSYSLLRQTTNLAIAEYGPISSWEFYDNAEKEPNTNIKGSEHFARKYLMPYMNVMSVCDRKTCDYNVIYLNGKKDYVHMSDGTFKYFLNDGTAISVNTMKTSPSGRVMIYFDINGKKAPNKIGRDVFNIDYKIYDPKEEKESKLIFLGQSGTVKSLLENPNDGCNKKANGYYCSTVIEKSGWNFPKGYPW